MSKIVDAHAHVFTDRCRFADNPRHRPRYEAPLATYLDLLDHWGIDCGVLVQPSFLGTHNDYLMECLRRHPDRLRGVAVIDPRVSDVSLDDMESSGIRGTRLNWIGRTVDELQTAGWADLFTRLESRCWHVEVQAEGRTLLAILDLLSRWELDLVIDHFGRPQTNAWRDPVIERLCTGTATQRYWVKCSAPYRSQSDGFADVCKRLLESLGPQRLMWGSDWPWTEHEHLYSYEKALHDIEQWIPQPALEQVIRETPRQFYGFDT
ncbi:amidohydrolase family protein [Aidingimonas halophila]|uniref:Predicted metal-dependent hydrolase, TIM-barrel fold n=1 Tax=Aidingimonas halophila TaxID=574349 RepID=A0A1H2V4L8_9GAMM|nr:amidohydrolase family protein [Aidingimonas halophila]SDW63261.1 Predicted metal-dependent hydrolase, TIM-barrel fold [Aidingimonas halophila]